MPKLFYVSLCVSVSLGLLDPLPAGAEGPRRSDESAVAGLEQAFLQSRVSGDISRLRSIFASDGVLIHENGDVRSRDALAEEVTRESYWLAFESADKTINLFGDTGITHAVLRIRHGGGQIDQVRTTGVFVKRRGSWRIVSWQSTPLGSISEPPMKP